MPGPVSDSYDPEWGTAATREEIDDELEQMYDLVSVVLDNRDPMYIVDICRREDWPTALMPAGFSEKQWRVIRFALERARESL